MTFRDWSIPGPGPELDNYHIVVTTEVEMTQPRINTAPSLNLLVFHRIVKLQTIKIRFNPTLILGNNFLF